MRRSGARRKPEDQLTVRGVEPRLAAEIRRIARIERISLNRAALRLLAKGAGFGEPRVDPPVIGASLDHLMGTWSQSQADDLLDSIRSCEQIDRDFWR